MSEFISKSSWSRTKQIDNGEIHIITKNALLHALFEEVHCIFRAPVPIVLHQLISLGIFLDILEKLLVRGMKTLYAPLITSQQNFQYVTGSLYYSFHKNITILLGLQDTFFQQGFLVRKNFVESALRDTQDAAISSIVILFIPFVVNNSTAARMIRSLSSTRDVECFVCSPIFLPFLN